MTDLTEQQVITQQRLRKLEEIGFEFTGIAKKVWDEKFDLLKQFKEEFGELLRCCLFDAALRQLLVAC